MEAAATAAASDPRYIVMSTTEFQPNSPRRNRRWYQYSLRALLLLFTIVALALAAARTWSACRLDSLVDGYNAATEKGRVDDAERYARIAAWLYSDSAESKMMTWMVEWVRQHPDGGWLDMADSTGKRERQWVGALKGNDG